MDAAGESARTKARRPRAARACELCRLKKNKCNEGEPCTYCRNHNAECVYRTADKPRRMVYSTEYVRHLERQVQLFSAQQRLPAGDGLGSPGSSHDGLLAHFQTDYPTEARSELTTTPISQPNYGLSTLASVASSQPRDTPSAKEVSAVNRHTQNVEFYGSSSSISLLSRVQENETGVKKSHGTREDEVSLVSQLHNPGFFSSPAIEDRTEIPANNRSLDKHQHQHRVFLNGFFGSMHYIHPIIDKASFLMRCDEVWSRETSAPARSFMALYYSLLSLGALVGPRDEESSSMSNIECSRKLFDKSRTLCSELSMTTDLDMVQCFFFMAKICQNELNPHLSYMYTGLAVRTALAMGINRKPPADSNKSTALLKAESRTWWGLYSLETEMSFAMGRPDTLGVDLYHNRQYPQIEDQGSNEIRHSEALDPPQCAIIKCMVDFSRITRSVCLGIYLSASPPQRNLSLAYRIEQDLDSWMDNLPLSIRPSRSCESERSLKRVRDAQWMKRQRLVLSIRYHNVRMLLFASFLTAAASLDHSSVSTASIYQENISKCLESAKQTIEIIYETYRHHDFFRTWYYNTTYTLFAVSIILVYVVQEASESEKHPLFGYVEMSIEILETMDDCVVAKKAAKMIQRALLRARENKEGSEQESRDRDGDNMIQDITSTTFNHYWGPLNLMDGEIDVAFPFELGDLEDGSGNYADFGS